MHNLEAQESWRAGVMMTRPCDALPPVRGTYTDDAPLKDLVWFRAGGPAEVLFRPADADDLATFLAARPADLRVQRDRRRLQSSGARWRHSRRGGAPARRLRQDRDRRHAHARRRRGAGCRGGARRRRCRHRRPGIPARRARHHRRRAADECRLLWPRDQGHFRRSHGHRRARQQDHAQRRRHGFRLSQDRRAARI